MCIAIMLSLVLEVYATTENDVSDTNSVSAEALPENIKNLIENYDEIESKSENIDLGENLYDMSIPKDDEQTEVSVYSSEGATSGVPKLTITLIKCDINRDIYSNVNYDYSNYDRTVSSIYATNNRNSFSETHDTVGYLSTSQSIGNKTFGDKDDPVGDCTNFVSQCLKAGGMKEIEGSESSIKSWYYDVLLSKYYNASDTWGHAPSFCKHWGHTPNGEGIQSAYQTIIYHDFESALLDWDYILNTVKKGDVIQYYADSVGIFHSGIVFSVDKNARTIKYMQHSSTTSEAELNNRLRANVADEIIIHTF